MSHNSAHQSPTSHPSTSAMSCNEKSKKCYNGLKECFRPCYNTCCNNPGILPFFFDENVNPSQQVQQVQQQHNNRFNALYTKWIFPFVYFIMSFMSFQWIRPQRRIKGKNETENKGQDKERDSGNEHVYEILSRRISNIMVIFSIPAVAINIIPLVMFIIGWAECPYTHSSICYTLQFHFGENKSIPKLVLRDIPKGITQSNQ